MSTKTKNPAHILADWYKNLPAAIQEEILALTILFHPNDAMIDDYSHDERVAKFIAYLEEEDLKPSETVRRTLFVSRLISLAFSGRDTEAGWEKALDTNLGIREKLREENSSTEIVDRFLNDFHQRKEFWLTLAANWYQLLSDELNDSNTMDWFMENNNPMNKKHKL